MFWCSCGGFGYQLGWLMVVFRQLCLFRVLTNCPVHAMFFQGNQEMRRYTNWSYHFGNSELSKFTQHNPQGTRLSIHQIWSILGFPGINLEVFVVIVFRSVDQQFCSIYSRHLVWELFDVLVFLWGLWVSVGVAHGCL